MERTNEDRDDLEDDYMELDDFDELDIDADIAGSAMNSLNKDRYQRVLLADEHSSIIIPTGKKTKKTPSSFDEDSDDWQDPEDDIMFGFED